MEDEAIRQAQEAGEAEAPLETEAPEPAENPEVVPEDGAEPEAGETAGPAAKEKRFGRRKDREAELKKKLEEEKAAHAAQLAAEKDQYLRLAAEYDNYRRRSQKEKETIYGDGKSDTVVQLLPVYDNLERALKTPCTDAAFLKGVEMTMTQLTEIFTRLGITVIDPVGQPFDPAEQNAVLHVEDESLGENTVVETFQKGFRLGDKVIRFAMVKVAN